MAAHGPVPTRPSRAWLEALAALCVLLTVLIYFQATATLLRIDWTRYILPTLLLGALLSGLRIGTIVAWVAPRVASFTARLSVGGAPQEALTG